MSTINRTYQTALQGTALHNAVDRMLVEMRGMNANYHGMTHQWAGSTRAVITAGSAMSGTVTLQDGNPSTVTLNATLPSYAEFMRAQIETDITTLAQSHLAPVGGQAGGSVTSTARVTTPIDMAQVNRGIDEFLSRLPGWTGQIRDAITGATAPTETVTDPNAKPGMREPHAPDVAEPTPLWQRKWVPWAIGGTAVAGMLYFLLRK